MAEYIEREAYTCKDCLYWVACKKMLEAAGYIVSENYKPNASRCDIFTPSADVVEVVHGRWIWNKEYECVVCSNCEMSALKNYCGNYAHSNFCPNCGARMDGDSNG